MLNAVRDYIFNVYGCFSVPEQEKDRYASTVDVKVMEGSFLQFDLSMGCDPAKVREQPCFGKRIFKIR